MLNGKLTYSIKTRKNEDESKKDAKTTALTVNYDGLTDDDAKVILFRGIAITRQNFYRKHGIPASETVNAKDFAHGARQALTPEVVQVVALEAAKSDPKMRAALIAQLMAQDVADKAALAAAKK